MALVFSIDMETNAMGSTCYGGVNHRNLEEYRSEQNRRYWYPVLLIEKVPLHWIPEGSCRFPEPQIGGIWSEWALWTLAFSGVLR